MRCLHRYWCFSGWTGSNTNTVREMALSAPASCLYSPEITTGTRSPSDHRTCGIKSDMTQTGTRWKGSSNSNTPLRLSARTTNCHLVLGERCPHQCYLNTDAHGRADAHSGEHDVDTFGATRQLIIYSRTEIEFATANPPLFLLPFLRSRLDMACTHLQIGRNNSDSCFNCNSCANDNN